MALLPAPLQGEVWFVQLPSDPPDKGRRPVIVVSHDGRNGHPRASTVLVAPLSTSIHRSGLATHILLLAGETGLGEDSVVRCEDVSVVEKAALVPPRLALRKLSYSRVCEIAAAVKVAMGCV